MDFLSCLHFKNGKYDMVWEMKICFPALVIGTKASIGSTYNYANILYHRLIQAFEAGDLLSAQQLQQQSINMIRFVG